MNADVARLTARMLLGQRRTLVVALLALVPVGLALLFRFADAEVDPARWTARALLSGLVTATILPLVTLIFGTAAFGQDIEDGTAVYLLARPIPRRTIVLSRLLVAWALSAALLLPAALAAGFIAIQGRDAALVLGFTAALAAGALVYCAVFAWLSIVTSRALIVGLLYVFLWEGVLSGLFSGIRFLSIRQYTPRIAGALVDAPPAVFDPSLEPLAAIALALLVLGLFARLAVLALQRWEIGEAT